VGGRKGMAGGRISKIEKSQKGWMEGKCLKASAWGGGEKLGGGCNRHSTKLGGYGSIPNAKRQNKEKMGGKEGGGGRVWKATHMET